MSDLQISAYNDIVSREVCRERCDFYTFDFDHHLFVTVSNLMFASGDNFWHHSGRVSKPPGKNILIFLAFIHTHLPS